MPFDCQPYKKKIRIQSINNIRKCTGLKASLVPELGMFLRSFY